MLDTTDLRLIYALTCCVSGCCDDCPYNKIGNPEDLDCQIVLRKDINKLMDDHMKSSIQK